jgi:hypothetical protein
VRLLDLPQAEHFCAPLTQPLTGIGQSLNAFHGTLPKGTIIIREGTLRFDIHRVNLLNSVERWLLYSLGLYRRALDMLVPISTPWAHVSLYYSSFFAANAMLGMFGGWIGYLKDGNRVVDVERGSPGTQELRIHRRQASPNWANGSHRAFWDFFYDATAYIAPWAPTQLAAALDPVSGDTSWQITTRNEVNYDMFHAWAASSSFQATFKVSRVRKTLSGPFALQLEATERMLDLSLHFAKALSLSTFGLDGCGVSGSRAHIQKRLVTQAPPSGLVAQSHINRFLGM